MAETLSNDEHLVARLGEFFSTSAPWNRRLWSLGLVLSCREVLEASEAVAERILWAQSLDGLKEACSAIVADDPGVGGPSERRLLQQCLGQSIVPRGYGYRALERVVRQLDEEYLPNWRTALGGPSVPPPELAARSVASHLLDAGFSSQALSAWLNALVNGHERLTAQTVCDEALSLVSQPPTDREVLVAFSAAPHKTDPMPPEWRDAPGVAAWLDAKGFSRAGLRQDGGLVFTIRCRDEWAAAQQAGEMVGGIQARLALSRAKPVRPLGRVWVEGARRPLDMLPGRGVEVDAIRNSGTTYVVDPSSRVDAALELLSALEHGSPGTSAATAWAAIESLLVGPGDDDRGLAAERCADIVMCSLPRAELTVLAHAHAQPQTQTDPLAVSLRSASSNREKARMLEEAIRQGVTPTLENPADAAAYTRLLDLIHEPTVAFPETRRQLVTSLRRLFRQRNLVLHSGRLRSIALRPGLRVAAPLVAEGMNMIGYAWLASDASGQGRSDPLELAARAHVALSLVAAGNRTLYDLLTQ